MKGGELKRANHYVNLAKLNRARMRRAGFNDSGYPLWTKAEDKKLRRLYPDYHVLKQALPQRSYHSIRKRARDLKIATTRIPWTTREMALLKRSYPVCTLTELCQLLPRRTAVQIRSVAALKRLTKDKRARPHKPTGKPLYDAICQRAAFLNYSMRDVDELAGTKAYFFNGRCRDLRRVTKAIEALDGRLAIIWNDY